MAERTTLRECLFVAPDPYKFTTRVVNACHVSALEERIGTPCRALAFPRGGRETKNLHPLH